MARSTDVPRWRMSSMARPIAAVEQDDGGGDEVEGCRTGLLILDATIMEAAEAVEGDGTCEAVACLALVQLGGDGTTQGGPRTSAA